MLISHSSLQATAKNGIMIDTQGNGPKLADTDNDEGAIITLNAEGKVTGWCAEGERLTGYALAEIIGKHFTTFHSVENLRREKPAEVLKLARADGKAVYEDWHVRKDGSHFWARLTVTCLPAQRGGPLTYSVEMQ